MPNISTEGKIGIGLGLIGLVGAGIGLVGAGVQMKYPAYTSIGLFLIGSGIVIFGLALIGAFLLAAHHYSWHWPTSSITINWREKVPMLAGSFVSVGIAVICVLAAVNPHPTTHRKVLPPAAQTPKSLPKAAAAPSPIANKTPVEITPTPNDKAEAYLTILFGPDTIDPIEQKSKNIYWRAITKTGIQTFQPLLYPCSNPVGIGGQCVVEYKYVTLVMHFEKPLVSSRFNVFSLQSEKLPTWHQEVMTSTDAIIRFEYYPDNSLVRIESAQ